MEYSKIKQITKIYIPCLVVGIISALVAFSLTPTFNNQVIGSVNINKIIQEFIDSNKNIVENKEGVSVKSQLFMRALEKAMHDFSREHQAVLIVSDAVIVGAKDLTDVIRKNVKELTSG